MTTTLTCQQVRELAPGFVLGALEPEELIAVQDHIDACDAGHPEMDEFGGVVGYLALAVEPLPPPEWLRESLISAAKADLKARSRIGKTVERRAMTVAPAPLEAQVEAQAPQAGNLISLSAARVLRHRRAIFATVASIAAALAIVAAGVTYIVPGPSADASSEYINALNQPDTRKLHVASADAVGDIALLPNGTLYINLTGLGPTANDEVYAIWVTGDDGVPVKTGTFRVAGDGAAFLQVRGVSTSANLGVEIRKEANDSVVVPTGPIVVAGNISQ
jgi:hypothetical protein